jgi:hypothetical protein
MTFLRPALDHIFVKFVLGFSEAIRLISIKATDPDHTQRIYGIAAHAARPSTCSPEIVELAVSGLEAFEREALAQNVSALTEWLGRIAHAIQSQ